MKRWEWRSKKFQLAVRQLTWDWRQLLLGAYCVSSSMWIIGGWHFVMTGRPMGFFRYALLGLFLFLLWLYLRTRVLLRKLGPQFGTSTSFQKIEPEYEGHRVKLAEALLRTAAMVDRATAEAVHVAGQMPPEAVGGLRRRALEMARRQGLWEGFDEAERSLLMDDEGSWPQETTFAWLGRLEDVRVLRWVLGLDEVLVPFEFLTGDMKPVLATFEDPEEVTGGGKCLPPWDLRPAQSAANLMLNRCVAEGVWRGFFQVEDEETRRECLAVAEGMHESPGEDLLIGTRAVAAASDEEVQRIGRVALRREAVVTAVIDYLGDPKDAPFLLP